MAGILLGLAILVLVVELAVDVSIVGEECQLADR